MRADRPQSAAVEASLAEAERKGFRLAVIGWSCALVPIALFYLVISPYRRVQCAASGRGLSVSRRKCRSGPAVADCSARFRRPSPSPAHRYRNRSVAAGTVGATERQTYTLYGDTVNLAQRLERMNKELATDCLICGTTFKGAQSSCQDAVAIERSRCSPYVQIKCVDPLTSPRGVIRAGQDAASSADRATASLPDPSMEIGQ
jgi:hypothetical protein